MEVSLIIKMGKARGNNLDLPSLRKEDLLILKDLRKSSPQAFHTNMTEFLISEMHKYIFQSQVFRTSIMGETRGGKSEVGQSLMILYIKIFNYYLERGHFDEQDVFSQKILKKEKLDLGIDVFENDVKYIRENQSDYMYYLRKQFKDKEMKFGQIYIIDESKDSLGGLGSFSESLDLKNLNNIIAKFMQAEIWIQPLQMETKNAPYGLYVYQKDIKNKVNWCLLYRISRNAVGNVTFTFLGWIKVPLHDNKLLRNIYNEKKNRWIADEIDGSSDNRLGERKKIALSLAEDDRFSERSATGKVFKRSKAQQIAIFESWILDKKTQSWNQLERQMIVEEARLIADENYEGKRKKIGLFNKN